MNIISKTSSPQVWVGKSCPERKRSLIGLLTELQEVDRKVLRKDRENPATRPHLVREREESDGIRKRESFYNKIVRITAETKNINIVSRETTFCCEEARENQSSLFD